MEHHTKPWYRQFWPWFVISIPASSVVVGTVLLSFALTTKDSLVRSDYYKAGRMINEQLAQQRAAGAAHLRASLHWLSDVNQLVVTLDGRPPTWPGHLELELNHPTLAAQDRRWQLQRTGETTYAAPVDASPPQGRRHIRLYPPDHVWLLDARLELDLANQPSLIAPTRPGPNLDG